MKTALLYELERLIERASYELSNAYDDTKYIEGSTGISLAIAVNRAQDAVEEVRRYINKAIAKEEQNHADID